MPWLGPLTHCSHKYQQLPLIPVEEFLAQHPEHQDDDENTLMVARIDHERAEREALEYYTRARPRASRIYIISNDETSTPVTYKQRQTGTVRWSISLSLVG